MVLANKNIRNIRRRRRRSGLVGDDWQVGWRKKYTI
jgi:hypothetical protein